MTVRVTNLACVGCLLYEDIFHGWVNGLNDKKGDPENKKMSNHTWLFFFLLLFYYIVVDVMIVLHTFFPTGERRVNSKLPFNTLGSTR